MLAEEALAARSDEMGGDMNGRPFMWSSRTMAIGVLCKLIGKDPADFQVKRVRGADDPRGWIWAVDVNPGPLNGGGAGGAADGAAVRAFYAWWKDHHGEYGVKEEPSTAGLPRQGRARRGEARQSFQRPILCRCRAGEAETRNCRRSVFRRRGNRRSGNQAGVHLARERNQVPVGRSGRALNFGLVSLDRSVPVRDLMEMATPPWAMTLPLMWTMVSAVRGVVTVAVG